MKTNLGLFLDFEFLTFFHRLYQKAMDDDILTRASSVAFYFAFALFPLLLFLLSVLGFVLEGADDLRAELFDYLRQVMPSSAFDLVATTLEEVVESSSGGKLTFGLLVTLYSASAGLDSVRIALNGVYNLKENRPWWKTKLISVLLTLALGLLTAVALAIIFYGSQAVGYVLPIDSPVLQKIFGYATILVVLILAFALTYNFLPNHNPFSWKWVSPGAIIGIGLWVLFSGAFRLYLSFFDSYAKTYGSLGAVIVLLLWLYLTALVILIGGAINAIFDEMSGVKKEAADPEQEIEEKTEENAKKR